MNKKATIFKHPKTFTLEGGGVLSDLEIAYHTIGHLNEEKDNVVWVFHALTANSEATDWWKGLFESDSAINSEKYFIICANILGSPYGTTSPLSVNPNTGQPYYSTFPRITIRDMVAGHRLLRDHLGIRKIAVGLGGSMGGFQTYEWAVQEPELFEKLILVATAPKESPWRISIHAAQRMAIEADPTWKDDGLASGSVGVAASRAIGMLSYRNHKIFEKTQSDQQSKLDDFKADSYIRYQGGKLANRGFNGFLLWNLTKALDSHDLSRGRGTLIEVLEGIRIPILQIGISSDILFPIEEQRNIADHLANVRYQEIDSLYGHDGFLTEIEKLNLLIDQFLN